MSLPMRVCPKHEQAHRVTEPCPYCDDRPKAAPGFVPAKPGEWKMMHCSLFGVLGGIFFDRRDSPWMLALNTVDGKPWPTRAGLEAALKEEIAMAHWSVSLAAQTALGVLGFTILDEKTARVSVSARDEPFTLLDLVRPLEQLGFSPPDARAYALAAAKYLSEELR